MSCIEGTVSIEDAARRSLMESVYGGLLPGEKVADLFCGAGGWGEGGKRLGMQVDFAVNHWDEAIGTHARNNPECQHHLGDAWKAKPRDVIGRFTRLGVLLASAACTTHSRAKGAAPVSKRVHMLGWCIARWMEDATPRIVLIENVPEWQGWGPLMVKRHRNGRPVRDAQKRIVRVQNPKHEGQHFRKWWRYCEQLGYRMEMRTLDAVDFGEASRRKRLFIMARRDGQPICWAETTHGKTVDQDCIDQCGGGRGDGERDAPPVRQAVRSERGCGRVIRPYRSAAEIIDWSDLGTSIFERPRPLKPKTLARICEGIRRFVLNDPRPFVLRVTQTGEGSGWKVWPVSDPLPTQTTRQDFAVCTPVIAPQNTGVFGQRVDRPGPAITTKGHQALLTPILASAGGSGYAGKARRIDRMLNTVKTDNRQCLVSPVMVTSGYGERSGQRPRCGDARQPLNTVVALNAKQAVVAPVMACLRNNVAPVDVNEPPKRDVCRRHRCPGSAALMLEYYGNSTTAKRADGSLGCVTTLDRHALVTVLIDGVQWVMIDILFRMLRPHELAAAIGFPSSYLWPACQRDATRLIGNAVSVRTAAALIGAALPRLGSGCDEIEVAA